ncbi:hypothetical protein ACYB6N_18220 [Klebsiella pneumoniae]|nr:hypothetical protein [Klebsiella pneumoniae]
MTAISIAAGSTFGCPALREEMSMDKAYEDYFESLSEGEEALSFSEFTAALSGKPADCASSEM